MSPEQQLFDRRVLVQVTQPLPGSFFELSSVTTDITDLRVTFQVEKHLGKEPNTCTVVIYNLAERSRALFQTKPLHVRLEAGYGNTTALLFAGDVRWAQSKHVGTEWETTVQLADGDRAFRTARVSKSFKSGVKARAAVITVINTLGLPVPAAVRSAPELDAEYAGGLALSGAASSELSRLLAPYGLSWSIQDGRLQVLRERDVRPDVPLEISERTGMISTPELASPEGKKKTPTLSVQNLLYPALVPGGRIKMVAQSIRGLYKVRKVRHFGDTAGNDWTSDVEATPV